jgi:hypothetical protein
LRIPRNITCSPNQGRAPSKNHVAAAAKDRIGNMASA